MTSSAVARLRIRPPKCIFVLILSVSMWSVALAQADPKGLCFSDKKCTKKIDFGRQVVKDKCSRFLRKNGGSWREGDKDSKEECCEFKGGGAFMDPHFMTWSGHRFDYQGACDLVLLHSGIGASLVDLDVHIRTKMRYRYSYIESAALRIGDDILEVSSWGDFMVNGVLAADMPTTLGDYAVAMSHPSDKEYLFDIRLDNLNDDHIYLKTFKDFVSVEFASSSELFKNSQGLMGDSSGRMLARDGETVIEDPITFGQQWQVQDTEPKLFMNKDDAPQHPQECLLPVVTKESRRLGSTIARSAAEKACAHWKAGREECIYDVMATGDLELAGASEF